MATPFSYAKNREQRREKVIFIMNQFRHDFSQKYYSGKHIK